MKKPLTNQSGLLRMSYPEILHYHQRVVGELQSGKAHEYTFFQYQEYVTFLRNILGIDIEINKQEDPFFEVTGFPIQKFMVDKWHGSKRRYASVMTADFISSEHMDKLSNMPEIFPDEDAWFDPLMTQALPFRVCYRTIGHVNVGSTMSFNHGVIHYYNLEPDQSGCECIVSKGFTFLDEKAVNQLKASSVFEEVYKILVEIGTWSGHDVTGHMTLDVQFDGVFPEGLCYKDVPEKELREFERFYGQEQQDPLLANLHTKLEERRLFSLHQHLVHVICTRRPAILKMIYRHFGNYYQQLRNARKNQEISFSVCQYFLRLYTYHLIRLLPLWYVKDICRHHGLQSLLRDHIAENKIEEDVVTFLQIGSGAPFGKILRRDDQYYLNGLYCVPHREFFQAFHQRMFTEQIA